MSEKWKFDEIGARNGCPQVIEAIGGHPVAQLRGWGHLTGVGGLNLPHEQAARIQDARGRLLAAAPDLLAALIPAAVALCSMGCPSVWKTGEEPLHRSECIAARSAIAKAEVGG